MNHEKLEKLIVQHKKLMTTLKYLDLETESRPIGILVPIQKTAKEISLVIAEFKCQKCKDEEYLQYHHLITRDTKQLMDFKRYLSCRMYFGNIIILCHKCHKHNYENSFTIPRDTINKLKKKYDFN